MLLNSFKLITNHDRPGTYNILLNGKELTGVKEVFAHVSRDEIPMVVLEMVTDDIEIELPETEAFKTPTEDKKHDKHQDSDGKKRA